MILAALRDNFLRSQYKMQEKRKAAKIEQNMSDIKDILKEMREEREADHTVIEVMQKLLDDNTVEMKDLTI